MGCKCGMRIANYSPPLSDYGSGIIHSVKIVLGFNSITWNKFDDCYIQHHLQSDKYVKFNWMPFDLTEEQLKLYLTFS